MLRKHLTTFGTAAIVVLILGCLCAKAFYFGWERRQEASLQGYQVKSFKTVSSMDPRAFMGHDGDQGYYRIFDRRGRKVYELFSDSLNFDVVISAEDGVEFQLGSETRVWALPKD